MKYFLILKAQKDIFPLYIVQGLMLVAFISAPFYWYFFNWKYALASLLISIGGTIVCALTYRTILLTAAEEENIKSK